MVYVREAHPADSNWADPELAIPDPRDDAARRGVAGTCRAKLGLTMPAVVDGLDDAVSLAYNGWPERIYVLRPDGTIAYRGGLGPFGFDPRAAGEALGRLVAGGAQPR